MKENNIGEKQMVSPIMLKSEKKIEEPTEVSIKTEKVKEKERCECKKRAVFLTGLLAIVLILTFTFTLKLYEPANNLIVTGGILIYPISFLVIALISKYYGFKEARRSILISSVLYVIFILLAMVSVLPDGNLSTTQHNAVIQYLFANNVYKLGGFRIFYPTLGQFFGVLIGFVISHFLFSLVYHVIHDYTVDTLAVGLSLFIGYIIDRFIFVFLLFSGGLMNKSNTFDFVIKVLTSEFMAAIVAIILIVILYTIITKLKKPAKA